MSKVILTEDKIRSFLINFDKDITRNMKQLRKKTNPLKQIPNGLMELILN